MRLRRLGLLGAAVSFARSERGRRMLRDARQKYDTPAHRAKVQEMLAGLKGRRPAR
jgi:hypothetical protein